MEDKEHNEQKDQRDVILDLNFVPQWARKPPGENHYTRKEYSDERRAPRRDGRRDGARPPRRDDRNSGRRPPRSDRTTERRPRPVREPVVELPVDITFLPEQKRLASLVRQIHHSRRAYPLMDLANLLIHDAEGYLVKIEAAKGTRDFKLFQCRQCKAVASTEELMVQHILAHHLTDFFVKEEIEGEQPSGNFSCVARCRKTGTLIGPPNHHSYNEKLNELHQSRFPNLSLEDFKRNIETVHDEAVIEQWKEESRKQTVYKRKSDLKEAPADQSGEDGAESDEAPETAEVEVLDLRRAELEFKKKVPTLYDQTQRAIVPAKVAQALEDRSVTHAIHRMFGKETRFPLTMSFSMRAAFRHMHLHVFKAGKINFVTHIKPNPVNPEDTVSNIAEVLSFLKAHPGSTRKDLLEVLHPSLDPESNEAKEALKPLGWLIDRGHIIEFFNGHLSVPLGRNRR